MLYVFLAFIREGPQEHLPLLDKLLLILLGLWRLVFVTRSRRVFVVLLISSAFVIVGGPAEMLLLCQRSLLLRHRSLLLYTAALRLQVLYCTTHER
jgi:hypothetical protein